MKKIESLESIDIAEARAKIISWRKRDRKLVHHPAHVVGDSDLMVPEVVVQANDRG